ncbi:MAG: hypothetical protein AAF990_09375 [Bacteroidota bacterium]
MKSKLLGYTKHGVSSKHLSKIRGGTTNTEQQTDEEEDAIPDIIVPDIVEF